MCSKIFLSSLQFSQFSLVTQLCLTLWDPMNRSTPGLPVHHQLPEFTQTHVHRVSDAIQPSHPLSPPSPPAPNPSQHQSLFQWVNSSHEVAKLLMKVPLEEGPCISYMCHVSAIRTVPAHCMHSFNKYVWKTFSKCLDKGFIVIEWMDE